MNNMAAASPSAPPLKHLRLLVHFKGRKFMVCVDQRCCDLARVHSREREYPVSYGVRCCKLLGPSYWPNIME